jgi:hypothetical protein
MAQCAADGTYGTHAETDLIMQGKELDEREAETRRER